MNVSMLKCVRKDDHIVKEPVSLSCGCGHYICKDCIPDIGSINCKICRNEIQLYDPKETEIASAKEIIKSSLNELFEDLEKHATDEIRKVKRLLEEREPMIDAKIKYIEEEIEIRILSMKDNLDKLFEKFKDDLAQIKIIELKNDAKTETNDFEIHLNELRDYIKNNQSKTEEKFYEYQENLKDMNKLVQRLEDQFYNCNLDLNLSEDQIDKSLVGEISFEISAKLKFNKIKETILNGKFENIPLEGNRIMNQNTHPYGISVVGLPNGNLVYSSCNTLKLVDANFKIIKSIDVGGEGSLALNRRNQVYFSCYGQKCILLLDLNLNRLKKVSRTNIENTEYLFELPNGLCCYEDCLYVCDLCNRRIQIFTLDLNYEDTIFFERYHPRGIQISDSTIGVSCEEAILFYDLKTRALKHEYTFSSYEMSYIDSIFFAFGMKNPAKIYSFDSNGTLIEEIKLPCNLRKYVSDEEFDETAPGYTGTRGSLVKHKDNLYMAGYFEGKLLKFS